MKIEMDNFTESSGVDTSPESHQHADIDTSPDMNSSIEVNSPDRMIKGVQPRKLTFAVSPDTSVNNPIRRDYMNASITVSPKKLPSLSPPYRKVRALRLFDTPATPKTIIQKSSATKYIKLFADSTNKNNKDLGFDILPRDLKPLQEIERPKAVPLHNRALDNVIQQSANVNPFTPDSLLMANKKRSRTQLGRENCNQNNWMPLFTNMTKDNVFNKKLKDLDDDDFNDVRQAPKRLALQDTNISRYKKEFVELSLIGIGEFGLVYQCLNRLDGCIYAIKKSIKPVAGSSFEKTALNEVWAHAVLGKHDNVVRYYSAWAEDNHMLIQNEFCNGGSLQAVLQKRSLCESELRTLLMHIAEGLKYIHSNDLVHMDLKSGNIFMTKMPARPASAMGDSCDDGFEDIYDELESAESIITYKIGDLGHVTSIKDPQVEEGDCRYLPNEILQEDFRHLCKADIFSLGITLFEAASGGQLPKNGPEWHKLRNGELPNIPSISREFNDLIKLMTHPNPEKRPSSTSIFNHPVLCSAETKTKTQLVRELSIERQKNEILLRKLKETKKLLKSYENCRTPLGKPKLRQQSPVISDRRLRSYSRKGKNQSSNFKRMSLRDKNKIIDEIDY